MDLAEPGQRLVARIIDLLVVGLPVVLVAQALLPARGAEAAESVGLAVVIFAYDAVQHAFWGRTLGKRIVGTAVVTVPWGAAELVSREPSFAGDPSPGVSLSRALLRAFVFAVPIALRSVPVLGLLAGLVWVAGVAAVLSPGRARQALHDGIARTAVVSGGVSPRD